MHNEQTACWINGRIVNPAEASVSVFDHGLLYGDGVFEGIRFYHGKPFRLGEHLTRLKDSADALGIPLPYPEDELRQAIDAVIKASQTRQGYIRLIITRGAGSLGIDPNNCHQPTAIIIAAPLQMVSEQKRRAGLKLMISSVKRIAVDMLDGRIKSLNYLNNILAKLQANAAGADEAVLLNAAGYIAEGSADNIFVVKNGCLYTPPASEGALAGVTRNAVIELAASNGITVSETRLAPYDLYTAEECFLTGTGVELLPVSEVDGRQIKSCPGETFKQIEKAFQQLTGQT